MKHLIYIKRNKHFVLVNFLLLLSTILLSQQYPINVNTNVLTPMPSKLTNFYSDNTQKLFVILTNKDLGNPSIPAKLKVTIIGSNTQIVSRVGSEIGVSPILLDAGVPKTLTQQDLAPYFNINNLDFVGGFSKSQYSTTGVLPEGNYSICVQVLDFYNNRPLSTPMCTYGSIFFSQPPSLLAPLSNATINGQDNKVINFNWTPNHLNNRDVVSGGFKYIVTLKEILDSTQNINQAYITANTKLTQEVSNNQFILNTMTTPLISGRKYAWTVQVKANNPEAQSTLANNGISQVYGFTYEDNCNPPKKIIANVTRNKATISWQNVYGSTVSTIKYKELNGIEYTKNTLPYASSIILEDLNYQTTYEFSIVVRCGSTITVLDPQQFKVLAKPIAPKFAYKNRVQWSVKEGSQGDYTATGFQLKTIFQGISSKSIETAIPNNKFDLKTKNNDTTITVSNSTANIITKKPLKEAKITLFENGEILQSVTANARGDFEMPIDTERIMENPNLRYYVRYDYPNQQSGINNVGYIEPDSILLTGMRSGKDIVKALNSREIVLASDDYTIIHPVVYVGQNQSMALRNKAGGTVDVFILTTDKSSLSRRILGYVENPQKNESYGGESYVHIGTLNDTKAFLPIVNLNEKEKLLFKVSLKDFPTDYYPLSILPENRNTKILNIPLDYNPLVNIQGIVYKNTQNQKEGLNKSAVIAYNKTTNEIIDATTTNTDGSYMVSYIPLSKVGNIFINAAPFNEKTKKTDNNKSSKNYLIAQQKITNNAITQDITYDKPSVDIVYGQAIMSTTKKAMANVTIHYDNVKIGKTTEDGFFAFKLNSTQRDPSKFSIICDGKELDKTATTQFMLKKFSAWESYAKTVAYSKSDEHKNKANSPILNDLITKSKDFGEDSRKTASILLDTVKENLGNYYQANLNIADIFYYRVVATYRGVREPVVLTDVEKNTTIALNEKDTAYLLSSDKEKYKLTVKPIAGKRVFCEQRDLLFSFSRTSPEATIVLKPLIYVTGTVVDGETNKGIDSVSVVVDALNASTVSNTKGEYKASFGETSEVKLLISKKGYYSKDTTVKIGKLMNDAFTVNLKLKRVPNAQIAQLAGFDVKITSQQFLKDSTYTISGKLTLNKNNKIFAISEKTNTLTFSNIDVRVNAQGNAAPVIDSVKFTESQLDGTMFNFAPIVINKMQFRRKMDGTSFYEGVLTGLVTVKASSFKKQNPNLPLAFGDATLQIPNNTKYLYIASSNTQNINAFNENNTFFLRFDRPGESAGVVVKQEVNNEFVSNTIMSGSEINSSKDKCYISKDGITLTGEIGITNPVFGGSNIKVPFTSLQIDTTFRVRDLTIDLAKAPIKANLKKWQIQLEQVRLVNINEPQRRGLGFGGKLFLTKPAKNAKDAMRNVLTVTSFEIKKDGEGLAVAAKFIPPAEKGINVKAFKFTPSQDKKEIEMAYSKEDGFSLRCAGNITCTDVTSNFSTVTKKIFPLEVTEFSLKSKNWALFAAVKPTTEFDFKGVKITLTNAVINVGTGMTIDKMNSYLLGTKQEEPAATPDEFDEEDPKVSWAFGIAGSVGFGAGDISPKKKGAPSGSIATSFVVGQFGNKIDFRINDIEIEFTTPAVELSAKVQLKLAGDTIGVAGAGKILIGGFGLDTAAFHYYRIRDKDIDIGAMVRVAGKGVTTGPVTWYSIGGGFRYESSSTSIEAYLTGTVGPAGTTKETTTGYVDIERIGVSFNGTECGPKPILEGTGHLFLKKPGKMDFMNLGTMDTKVDFCQNVLLVTLKGGVDNFLPGVHLDLKGVLYSSTNNGKAVFFLNAFTKIKTHAMDAHAELILGINFDDTAPGLPEHAKQKFKAIPNEAKTIVDVENKVARNSFSFGGLKDLGSYQPSYPGYTPPKPSTHVTVVTQTQRMNALVINAGRTKNSSQDRRYSIDPLSAHVRYDFNQSTLLGFIGKFAPGDESFSFNMRLGADYSGSASIGIFGVTIGAGFQARIDAQLKGAYSSGNGFSVDGEVSARVEGHMGNCVPGCNDWCAGADFWEVEAGAKACFDAKLNAGWSQRGGFYIR
jgi:hypothetical protein